MPSLPHPCFGALPIDDGAVEFALWSPSATEVVIDIVDGPQGVPMAKRIDGFHYTRIGGLQPGTRYYYRIDDGPRRPDPASRFQPDGVHGPSEVIDPKFDWTDADWAGPIRDQLIIYELHIGTFTDCGTFESAIDRLDELVDLGITAIELMPVAASAGDWNWGYDGVAFFAPMAAYGTPHDFRRFVDEAHRRNLSVFLDVVYNHLGPEGNYLSEMGPYLSDRHSTAWGQAPNLDDPIHGDSVRQFFLANAIYWLDEFHLDGLRVDAIHCIVDEREPHFAVDLSAAVDAWSQQSRRNVMLIAESNVYDPEMTEPRSAGGIGFDAMWCDDFLHSSFSTMRPGEQLCQREYVPKTDFELVLNNGYLYLGTLREERSRHLPERRVATHPMVYSIQNHDFIGNHPQGKRLHQLTSDECHRVAAGLMLMAPAIPMLFMGEEFACEHPFCFFVDFSDERLRRAVVEGRQREYPQHQWSDGVLPTDPEAFRSAKIGPRDAGNLTTLQWYKDLIRLRTQWRREGLLTDTNLTVQTESAKNLYTLRYQSGKRSVSVIARLSDDHHGTTGGNHEVSGRVLFNSRTGDSQWDGKLMSPQLIIVDDNDSEPA